MRDKEQDMSVKDFYQKVDQAKLKEVLSSDDPNELKRVAKDAGFELSDEQLDYVAGGVSYEYDSSNTE